MRPLLHVRQSKELASIMVVWRMILVFAGLTLTSCAAAIALESAAPTTGPTGAALNEPSRIGASDGGDSPRQGGFGAVGGGSFLRSFLIPGTDTSIRLGG